MKSVRVKPEIWLKARVKALSQGLTMEELINKLLTQYTGGKKRG